MYQLINLINWEYANLINWEYARKFQETLYKCGINGIKKFTENIPETFSVLSLQRLEAILLSFEIFLYFLVFTGNMKYLHNQKFVFLLIALLYILGLGPFKLTEAPLRSSTPYTLLWLGKILILGRQHVP